MKNLVKLAVITLCLVGAHSAHADVNMAKLKMKFSGPVNDRSYYLCVSNAGCSNISAAAKGKVYMMDVGAVNYIFAADMKNLTMHTQALPASCQVKLAKDQTLEVFGKLKVKNNSAYVDNMKCKVT